MKLLRPLLLATDLDGTFLGGDQHDRQSLYDFIEQNRENIRLVFVTGRDLPFVEKLWLSGLVPRADDVIGDVGTTVVCGATLQPHAELHEWIQSCWGDAFPMIEALVANSPGLRLQPPPMGRCRASYYYNPHVLDTTVIQRLEGAGFDVLLSDNVYLDVLPRGVNKGTTLARFVEIISAEKERVLVAGDTMNDFSLFETGYNGVVVGGAETALVERTENSPSVLHASSVGAGGIIEALRFFGFVS